MSEFELPDVDIDVKHRDAAVDLFSTAIVASQIDQHSDLVRHKNGLYFQGIPQDPITKLAAFPYDLAEKLGYYKIDFLPYHIYDMVENNAELDELLRIAEHPGFPWEWFLDERFYENEDTRLQLTQLARHHHLCQMYPPHSVQDVAILNALIRPRKRYLVGRPWDEVVQKVWEKRDDETGYFFKKSHAVAFALAILVHMQLIAYELNIDIEGEKFYQD